VDRHEHIGRGKIGLEGFRLLLNDPRFRRHPMVIETPKGKDLLEDRQNLEVLRSLLFN
jgi:deoxyribonuclease IV